MKTFIKFFNGIIVPFVCVGIMIGGWIWLIVEDSKPGSYAIGLFLMLIPPNIALFIVAIVFTIKFFNELKKEFYLSDEFPEKKNYKALVGAIVQIALILAAAIWVTISPFGMIFALPAVAVIIWLSLGAELCIKKFRRSLKYGW